MIPSIANDAHAQASLDPVCSRYRSLFATLDWSVLPVRSASCSGPKPNPPETFVKTLIVKVAEGKSSIAALRRYLLEHPALVHELGFQVVVDPDTPLGIDLERTVPSERWLRYQQQHLGDLVEMMLAHSVQCLREHDTDLGSVVALDATHHYAWVRENNPNQSVTVRYDREHQPSGDPDCRLGGKKRPSAPKRQRTEAFWGYHSMMACAPSRFGEVAVAAHVQAVVAQEITLFPAVARRVEQVLGGPPKQVIADAAFDAWSVYQWVATAGGYAAIALNPRGGAPPRDSDGAPLCAQGLPMQPGRTGIHEDGYRVQYFDCPLQNHPGATCSDHRFSTGGCHKRINIEPGGLLRNMLDRSSVQYITLYHRRTSVERLFSRLKAWGLDRVRARRLTTLRTVILVGSLLINLLALDRATKYHATIGGTLG